MTGTTNNFTFTTGTTGDQSTIKVKGAARLGLDDVRLGCGNCSQDLQSCSGKHKRGRGSLCECNWGSCTTPPDNLVEGYYPLYIDEGELTFDNAWSNCQPKKPCPL